MLGPLVATAVAVEVPRFDAARLTGRERFVRDSKKVFQRTPSSYQTGERIALEVLRHAGHAPGTLERLIDAFALLRFEALVNQAGPSSGRMLLDPQVRLPLPVWAGAGAGEPSDELETEMDARPVRGVAIAILMPRTFNEVVAQSGSKTYCDFSLFMDLAVYGPPGDAYVLGKIGGTKRYSPLLERYTLDRLALIPKWKAVRETPSESLYRFEDGREFRFARDADSLYAPVALASIVGKYARELFMQILNRYFGYGGPLPHASGYPGDPKTADLLRRIRARIAPEDLPHWVRTR